MPLSRELLDKLVIYHRRHWVSEGGGGLGGGELIMVSGEWEVGGGEWGLGLLQQAGPIRLLSELYPGECENH